MGAELVLAESGRVPEGELFVWFRIAVNEMGLIWEMGW